MCLREGCVNKWLHVFQEFLESVLMEQESAPVLEIFTLPHSKSTIFIQPQLSNLEVIKCWWKFHTDSTIGEDDEAGIGFNRSISIPAKAGKGTLQALRALLHSPRAVDLQAAPVLKQKTTLVPQFYGKFYVTSMFSIQHISNSNIFPKHSKSPT